MAGHACGLGLRVHGAPPGMPVNSPRSHDPVWYPHMLRARQHVTVSCGCPCPGSMWSEHRSGMQCSGALQHPTLSSLMGEDLENKFPSSVLQISVRVFCPQGGSELFSFGHPSSQHIALSALPASPRTDGNFCPCGLR